MLETVKSAWEALGFTVTLTPQDVATFTLSRNSLQYSDVLCSVWETDVEDQELYLQPYISSNIQSGCGYTNPAFDQLMLDAIQGDESSRSATLTEAEQTLLDHQRHRQGVRLERSAKWNLLVWRRDLRIKNKIKTAASAAAVFLCGKRNKRGGHATY